MILEKQYARRSVLDYKSPYEDPFEYKPITEVNHEDLLDLIRRVQTGSAGRDIVSDDPASEFDGMIEFANTAYDPYFWKVAYLDRELAGVVFAQRYFDKMEEGSLFLVGLVPEFRGRGFGKILHARGLEMLAEMGVLEYVGSTDVQNVAMIRIFEANECRLTAIRKVEFENGHGTGIAE